MTVDTATAAALQRRGWDLLTADDNTRIWEHFNEFRGDVARMVDENAKPYTPSLGGFTIGSGTNTGLWKRDDIDSNYVECWTEQKFGTGSAVTAGFNWSVPVPAVGMYQGHGFVKVFRLPGPKFYQLFAHGVASTGFGAYFGSTGPTVESSRLTNLSWTGWQVGDTIWTYYKYRATGS